MPIENFSGNPISSTYQRVVQTDGTYLADGTGSILNILNITASYALNASGSSGGGFPFSGSAEITGSLAVTGSSRITQDLYVDGTIYAQNTVTVTQSYYSGSNIFGDAQTDTQRFTGSVRITGSADLTGSLNITNAINAGGTITTDSEASFRTNGTTNNTYSRLGIFNFSGWQTGTQTAFFNGWNQQSYINSPLNIGLASTTMPARLRVRGAGTTSATTAFLIEDSAGNTNAQIYDDGQWFIGTGNIRLSGTPGNFHFNTAAGNVANIGHWGINFQPLGYSGISINIDNKIALTGSTFVTGSLTVTGSTILRGNTSSTGSISITGSAGTGSALQIYKSGSTVLDVQGSSGQLFSITDSLTGSLFSVNTVAGLPVMEAFSDNTVNIGKFGVYPIKVAATGTLAVITGSLLGTASFASTASFWSGSILNAVSSSFASTSSYINPLTQSVNITGGLSVQGRTILNGEVLMGLTNRSGTNILYYDIDNSEITQDRLPGSTGQIFFNDNDNFQADSGLNWDNISKILNVTGSITSSQNIQVNSATFGISHNLPASRSLNIGWDNLTASAQEYYYANIAVGSDNLKATNWGAYNVAIGYNNLQYNTSGSRNIAIGSGPLNFNTTGNYNIGIGSAALSQNRFGSHNIGLGYLSLGRLGSFGLVSGSNYNIGLGLYVGYNLSTGSNNIIIGTQNDPIYTGDFNTFIGSNISIGALGSTTLNKTVAITDGSGSIRLFSPSSSNVIIGGITDLGYKFQVSGSGNFTSNLTITGSATNSLLVKGSGTTFATTTLRVENANTSASLVVLDNGNVGIGTTEPSASLQIGSFIDSFATGLSAAGNQNIIARSPSSHHNWLPYADGNNYYSAGSHTFRNQFMSGVGLYVTNTFTGVGTNVNSGYTFDVAGSGRFTSNLTVTGSTIISSSNATQLQVGTNLLFVSSSGRVGIGTTTPNYILDVYQTNVKAQIRASGEDQSATLLFGTPFLGTSSPKTAIIAKGLSNWSRADLHFCLNTNQGSNAIEATISDSKMVILNEGNVGIGTVSPTAKLNIVGSGTTTATNALLVQNASSTNLATINDAGQLILGTINSGSANDQLIICRNNGWSSIFLDAGFAGESFYKTTIVSRRDFGQPFYIEKDGARLIDTWEGGGGMTLPDVIVQGLRAKWQTLETNGTYHHIHSPFGSWPSGIKLTNPSTNTGSTDGVYMGLWTSGIDARLWNYETNGTWEIGVGNIKQLQVTTSSTTVYNALLGEVETLPTASGTASMDCSKGNFFTLTLSGSYTLHLSASNIQPGQTINLRVTQPATSGSLSYTSQFKFAGGIPYTASSTGSAVDIVSFITFDSTNLYASAIKNLS